MLKMKVIKILYNFRKFLMRRMAGGDTNLSLTCQRESENVTAVGDLAKQDSTLEKTKTLLTAHATKKIQVGISKSFNVGNFGMPTQCVNFFEIKNSCQPQK